MRFNFLFNNFDFFYLFILILLSSFLYLISLSTPNNVCNEENLILNIISNIKLKNPINLTNPPLPYLIYTFYQYIRNSKINFNNLKKNEKYYFLEYINLRFISSLFSIIRTILIYFICKFLYINSKWSFLSSLISILETSLLINSRLITLDSISLFFLTLFILLIVINKIQINYSILTTILIGITLGLCITCNNIFISLIFPLIFISFLQYNFPKNLNFLI